MSGSYTSTILVTGSNSGIGYELVRLLAEKGHVVYMASRNEVAGKESQYVHVHFRRVQRLTLDTNRAKLKKEYNLDVKLVQLDVTDLQSVQKAKDTIEKAEGKLDVLVHNAGRYTKHHANWSWAYTHESLVSTGVAALDEPQDASIISLSTIRTTFEPNFYGLIQTTQVFLPLILAAPAGRRVILEVSTALASGAYQASPLSTFHVVAYSSSKAAANSYIIALAHELRDKDVKVNSATPGFTSTKLNGFKEGGKTAEEGAKSLLPYALLGPEDTELTGEWNSFLRTNNV